MGCCGDGKKKKWPLSDTQKKLWIAMVQAHEQELRPFQAYQEEQRRLLLESFAQELGIKKGTDISFEGRDVKGLHFKCAEPKKKAPVSRIRKPKGRARARKKSA